MPVPPERRVGNGVSDIRALSVWATGSGGQRAPSAPSAPTAAATAAATPGGLAGGARRRSVAALPLPTLSAGHSGLKYKLASGTGETGAVFDGADAIPADAPAWGLRRSEFCGVRGDRCLFCVHATALAVHLAFFLTCLIVSYQAEDPYLETWRQRFLFTRNTSFCGLQSEAYNRTDPDRVIAVLEPSGDKLHVGWLSAMFFGLSALAHSVWVFASVYDPLGNLLFGWLEDAYAPTRWLEYAVSAPLQYTIMLLLSGLRNVNDLAANWWLMSTRWPEVASGLWVGGGRWDRSLEPFCLAGPLQWRSDTSPKSRVGPTQRRMVSDGSDSATTTAFGTTAGGCKPTVRAPLPMPDAAFAHNFSGAQCWAYFRLPPHG